MLHSRGKMAGRAEYSITTAGRNPSGAEETQEGGRESMHACMHELKLVWLKCNILKVCWVTLKHNNLNHNVCPLKYTLADWVSCSSKCS